MLIGLLFLLLLAAAALLLGWLLSEDPISVQPAGKSASGPAGLTVRRRPQLTYRRYLFAWWHGRWCESVRVAPAL
jgi:hypothetical protein